MTDIKMKTRHESKIDINRWCSSTSGKSKANETNEMKVKDEQFCDKEPFSELIYADVIRLVPH